MLALGLLAVGPGCHAVDFYTPSLQSPVTAELEPPRELAMVSLPAYRIEPPDAIRLEVTRAVPRPPYRIGPSDTLLIRAVGTLLNRPIDNNFSVNSDGLVVLGPPYASVPVRGLTTVEAAEAVRQTLALVVQNPEVSVQVVYSAGVRQLNGDYQVEPDGVLRLHRFGEVNIAGMTVTEASQALEKHLRQWLDSPRVGVEVTHYNSESYYVIMPGPKSAESVQKHAITGNETVLDAIGRIQQFSNLSSTTMWVARPAPGGFGEDQILPVDWEAIAQGGETKTNYQLMPGDRLYVVEDNLVGVNAYLASLTAPVERLLGTALLGTNFARSTQTLGRRYNSNRD